MTILLLGLVLFLGAHSVRIFADGWRTNMISRLGAQRWKAAYSLVALVGLVLIVWGFAQARHAAPQVWTPPVWSKHLNLLVMLASMIMLGAAHSPKSHVKTVLHHPMTWSVSLFSAGHLLANGTQADIVLFGAFFVWSVAALFSAYGRDRRDRIRYAEPAWRSTLINIAIGLVVWAVIVFWLHLWLFGVAPLARG